jgi:hypothetical protein
MTKGETEMNTVGLGKSIVTAAIGAFLMIPHFASSATAGEGFFQKLGDGPKRVIQDIVTPNKVDRSTPTVPASAPVRHYSATYRVDCIDANTGRDRADNSITATSDASQAAAVNYILDLANRSDLCQANGDTSRITKPGSGRWMWFQVCGVSPAQPALRWIMELRASPGAMLRSCTCAWNMNPVRAAPENTPQGGSEGFLFWGFRGAFV